MADSPFLGFIVLGLVVAGFAVALTAILLAVKRRDETRKRAHLDAGFTAAPGAVEELAGRLHSLHHYWSSRHQVRDPWRKSEWGYELYLFDVRTRHGKSTTLERDHAIVVSRDLALPRFLLGPKASGDGLMAALANKAIAWVASHFAAQASFPEQQEFDSKLFLFGEDEADLRRFFDANRRGRLAEIEHLQVAGSGDGFFFAPAPYRSADRSDREKLEQRLQDILEDARRLFDILKS